MVEMSDAESKDQKFRNFLDRWVYSPSTSKLVATLRKRSNIFIGLISFVSSLAFVILSYWDFSMYDPCCSQDDTSKCYPACNSYHNIRLPRQYNIADICICTIFLVEYLLDLAIS